MTDVIALTLLAIGAVISLIALLTALYGLFPGTVAATRQMAETAPGRSLGLGVVNLLFLAAIALGFIALAEGLGLDAAGVPLVLLILLVGFGLHVALAGVAQLIGARLNPEWTPLQRSLRGGAALVLAALTPVVGWFVLLPYALLLGFGALILALWERKSEG